MAVFGYARVSTQAQNEARQLDALTKAGASKIYLDKQSGKDFERVQYRRLLRRLKKGDCLIIKSLDRLGRNYKEILEQWRTLTQKADVVVLDMPLLDTRKEKNLLGAFISDLVLQILSFVAENERAFILERQREGIAAAKRRGVRFGRPKLFSPPNFEECAILWGLRRISATAGAKYTGMKPTTFRRHAAEYLAKTTALELDSAARLLKKRAIWYNMGGEQHERQRLQRDERNLDD